MSAVMKQKIIKTILAVIFVIAIFLGVYLKH